MLAGPHALIATKEDNAPSATLGTPLCPLQHPSVVEVYHAFCCNHKMMDLLGIVGFLSSYYLTFWFCRPACPLLLPASGFFEIDLGCQMASTVMCP